MTQPSVNLLISLLFGICVLIGLIWVWTRPVVSKSSSSESNDKKSEDSTNDKKSTTSGSVDEQLLAWQLEVGLMSAKHTKTIRVVIQVTFHN